MKEAFVSPQNPVPGFLAGGGEMGKRIREFDWASTPLGPVADWPKSLMTCVQIMLTSRQPYWIGWGKDLIKLYNDPYKAIVGGKHPWALGKPASEVWSEIWKDIDPMLKKVMHENEGTYVEAQLLIMERNGYPEETYYTFSYTPVAGDSGTTEGMICANSDDTDRIISERQLLTLTRLGKALTDAKSSEDVYERTIQTIQNNPYDFPFTLFYAIKGASGTLVDATDMPASVKGVPVNIELDSSSAISKYAAKALAQRKHQVIEDIQQHLGVMPSGAWSVSPSRAIVLPVAQRGQKDAYGFLLVGINPYRLLDDKYIGFFELFADQVATSLGDVHAFEEERKRLEALAEIDRAKTTFFSNISHEFRTPLTLLLGPIQDVLNDADFKGANKEKMEVALRNAHRMQKLVNLLLDFSRIEAGRMEANFIPVDIVSVTEDLTSNFRSAIEKSGMELVVHKEVIDEPVLVDIEMYEKIFLNLISNAFKYSEKGAIEIFIHKVPGAVEVSVKDSGVGIPSNELEKIFDRFHRVNNARGRSQEGTGIGLAMVKELVKLHNGSISVTSSEGVGSTFTVSLPLKEPSAGREVFSGRKGSSQTSLYVDEAMLWTVEDNVSEVSPTLKSNGKQHTVLLADDNADMRRYMQRLLEAEYQVVVVNDGEQAFSKALEHKPDLILSDIMMPQLDGFGLLKKLKSNLATRNIPVIFLSARAGEEARIEGIQAGADDYLTKPFSSRELMARVSNHIAISNTRRKTEREFYNLFLQSPAHIHVMKGPEHVFEFFHPMGIAFTGRDVTGMKAREAVPDVEGQGFFEMLDAVYRDGTPVHQNEAKVIFKNEKGEPSVHYFNLTYLPWKDLHGKIQGVLQFTFEVTDSVNMRLKAEASERNFRAIAEQAPVAMCVLKGPGYIIQIANEPVLELWGRKQEEVINRPVAEALPEIVQQGIIELLDSVYYSGKPYVGNELAVELWKNGAWETVYLNFIYEPFLNADKEVDGIIVVAADVSEQVRSRKVVEEAQYKLKHAVELGELGTWSVLLQQNNFVEYSEWVAEWWGLPKDGDTIEALLGCIHEDDRGRVARTIEEAIQNAGYYVAEYRLINALTGQERYIQANGKVFYDDKHLPERLSGIVRDVTASKMTQQQLEQEVSLRTNKLMELNQDLIRSNENLKQFAYVASHDLQEPLRKIQTFSGIIKDNLGDQRSIHTYVSKIDTSAARMSALIKDVLLYSQIDKEQEKQQRVNLNEVLENVRNDFEILLEEKRGVIHSTTLPVIQGSRLHFHQLFSNLVGNALKFSDDEPVIEIRYRIVNGGDVPAELKPDQAYHFITFQDNGIGFEPEYAQQIFGLFTRLHNRKDYGGTGIGLALCKKIMESYGGSISARSKKGEGATFLIYFPVHTDN
jgi:PAS domain S-box-containing protein